jgi:putative transposase
MDQGSQFAGFEWINALKEVDVEISPLTHVNMRCRPVCMDGKGRWPPSHRLQANDCRAVNNRMIERLWRSLKYECIYLNAFETGSETRARIEKWMAFCNAERPHSMHGILTPNDAYDRKIEPMRSAA